MRSKTKSGLLFLIFILISILIISCDLFAPENESPVIGAITTNKNTCGFNDTVECEVIAFDPDGDSLDISWSLSGPGSINVYTSDDTHATYTSGTTAGTVVISVKVTDGDSPTVSGTVQITVQDSIIPPQISSLTAQSVSIGNSATTELEVTASNGEGGTLTYIWGILTGDGFVEKIPNTSKATYTAPDSGSGSTEIQVTVNEGNGGTDTGSITISYGPYGSGPTVNFSADKTSGIAPINVSFTDLSDEGSSPITEWSWDFGDSGTSTASNPTHTYSSPGTYSVSLTVTTSVSSDSKSEAGYIVVRSPPPSPTIISPANNITGTGTTLTLQWDTDGGSGLKYDVYLGTDPTPDSGELISRKQTSDLISLPLLHNSTHYYWKIVVWEGSNSTTGNTWSFTTETTTTVSYYPSKDSSTMEGNDDYNSGDSNTVQMGRMDWADWDNEFGYFQFDLTSKDIYDKFSIPSGANIADGNFNLSLSVRHKNGTFGSRDYFQVRKVTSSWEEDELTWKNMPSSEMPSGGSWWYGPFDDNQLYNFSDNNYTKIIRDWVSSPSNNFGMVFQSANFDDTDIAVYSKDYADQTKWPILSVTYTW